MRYPGFIGPAYQSRSARVDAQRCINLYPEAVESGAGRNDVVLYGTPGTQVFATLPQSPVRGLWAGDERLFAAAGSRLYEVSSAGTVTDRGNIGNDAANSPVQLFANGTSLFIVSAGQAYVDPGTGVTSTGQPAAITGAYLDGYYIVQKPPSGTDAVQGRSFAISNNMGATWDPLEFGVKEAYPDNINAILADHQELWLFGHDTTEVFRNSGAADFPFERDPGAIIHRGCGARWSPVRIGSAVGWLGGNGRGTISAYIAEGFRPVRVSTHAVEYAWTLYGANISQAISYTYEDRGHQFWVIYIPNGGTWVFDLTTRMWHERAYYDGSALGPHRSRCYARCFHRHLVGDRSSGAIYELTEDAYRDNGNAIWRIRTAPHLSDENRTTFYHRFELVMDTGTGLNGQPEPNVELQYSDDGGYTWSAARTAAAGAFNDFRKRVIWRRLGRSRDRVFQVVFKDPMRVSLIDAHIDATGGIS